MKIAVVLAIAGALLATPIAFAQRLYAYSCTWKSEVTPRVKIQFTYQNGIGGYQGALYMDGRWIVSFSEGSFQGYASNWWSATALGQDKPYNGTIVVFKSGIPRRSLSTRHQNSAPTKLLTVGLGSTLYYGRYRGNDELIRAAEGFWTPGKGCRHITGRNY